MPNMIMVSVFDAAVKNFGPAMCVQSEQAGIRSFMNEVNRNDGANILFTNRDDFSLYCVGEFDCETGMVVSVDPRPIIHGRDIVFRPVVTE